MFDYEPNEIYYEQSAADLILEEAKEKISLLLKQNVKDEIKSYIDEVAELKKRNKLLQNSVNEYTRKENQLKHEKQDLLKTVRKERLSELLKDFQVVMYQAKSVNMYHPKCDKCNENREIIFTTPSGKEMKEICECAASVSVNEPQQYFATSFNCKGDKLNVWYETVKERDYDYYRVSNYMYVIYLNQDYKALNKYETYFKTSKECQGYCDWLNKDIDLSNLSKEKLNIAEAPVKKRGVADEL